MTSLRPQRPWEVTGTRQVSDVEREVAERVEIVLARCAEHGKVLPHFRCEESERWLDDRGFPTNDGSTQ